MLVKEKKKLTIRVDSRLIEQTKIYAREHNTSISQLVETYFLNLSTEKEGAHSPLVQQLTGIIPADVDAEEAYQEYLSEKYG